MLTGKRKLYLGKVYIKEQINKLSNEEVDKLFNNYEAKLSGQMVNSLGKSIINQDALSEDLESDSFLNSALQKVYLKIILQIWFILSSLKRWVNYEQTLFI